MTELDRTLREIAERFSPVALGITVQAVNMVITDSIARLSFPITVFALDTERLHAETLELIPEIKRRYGIEVEVHRPQSASVAQYVQFYGRDAFYGSVDLRQRCCEIRKVEPLARALAGKRAWITGQRREQSSNRAELAEREFGAPHGLEQSQPR